MPVSRGTVTFGLDEIDPPRPSPTVTFGIDEIDAPEDRPALGPTQARADVFLRAPMPSSVRESDLMLPGRGSMPEGRTVEDQRIIESAPPYQTLDPRPRPSIPTPRNLRVDAADLVEPIPGGRSAVQFTQGAIRGAASTLEGLRAFKLSPDMHAQFAAKIGEAAGLVAARPELDPPEAIAKSLTENPSLVLNPDWWATTGGNVVGSMIPFAVAGAAGGAAAQGLRPILQFGAQMVGGAAGESFVNGGIAYVDARKQGATANTAAAIASEVAAKQLPVNTVLALAGFGASRIGAVSRAAGTVLGAVGEGTSEVSQDEIAARVLRKYGFEGQTDPAGSFVGGLMGGLGVDLALDDSASSERAPRPEPQSDPLPSVSPTELQAYMAIYPPEAPVSRRPASAPQGSVKPWPFTQTRPLAPVDSAAVNAAGGPDVAPAAPTLTEEPIGRTTGQPIGQTQEMSDSGAAQEIAETGAPVLNEKDTTISFESAPVLSEEQATVSDIQAGRSEATTGADAPTVTFAADEIEAVEPAGTAQAPEQGEDADEIRRFINIDAADIDAYEPAAAVRKSGRTWTYDLIGSKSLNQASYKTRTEAVAAAEKHKALKADQYANPTTYYDVTSLRATDRMRRADVYAKQGMSEMEAYRRIDAEDAATRAQTATAKAKPFTLAEPAPDPLPANAPADLPTILADARANGYTGTPDALAGAYRDIDGRRVAERGDADTSPVALLEAIRDAGGIATDGSGEVQTLWEASPGFIVAGKTKDGSRYKKTRKMPRGALLGVANVLKNDGTGLSWDGLREAIAQNPAFRRFADLNATDLVDEVMDAVARQNASPGRGSSRGRVTAAPGWWREVVNDAGLSRIEQEAVDFIGQYVDPANRRELYDWLREQADEDLSNVEVVALRRLEQEYASEDDRRPADSPVAGDLQGGADGGRETSATPVYASPESRTREQESALPGLERVRAQALGATDSKIARVSAQAPEDGFTLSAERADGRTLSARETLEESGQSSIFDAPSESEPQPFTPEAVADALGQPLDVARGVVAIAEAAGFDLAKRLRVAKGGTDNGTLYQSAPSPFYSRLIRAVEASSLSKASGAQWKATIRNAKTGINADEFALVGVADLFDPTTYTKQDVLDYLSANQVVVEDVTLGNNPGGGDETEYTEAVEARREAANRAMQAMGTFPARRDILEAAYRGDTEALPTIGRLFPPALPHAQEAVEANRRLARLTPPREPRQGDTQFGRYQEPGADPDSYREVFLTAPQSKASWNDGHAAYRPITNPIVRLRFNTRTTEDGARVLFLEEVQPPSKGNQGKMPPLLTKHWREIAFKWAVRQAASQGLDGAAWTPGKVQADRYSLRKQVRKIEYEPISDPAGTYEVVAYGLDGAEVFREDEIALSRVEELVGKDIAGRIERNEGTKDNAGGYRDWRTLTGDNLEVGGDGLVRLYDVDFKNVANAIPAVKKSGAKVDQAVLPEVGNAPILRITPQIRDAVMAGQPLFQARRAAPTVDTLIDALGRDGAASLLAALDFELTASGQVQGESRQGDSARSNGPGMMRAVPFTRVVKAVNEAKASDYSYDGDEGEANIPDLITRAKAALTTALYQPNQNGPNGARGSIEFLTESGQAIIRGFASADASTGVHEVAHAIRRFLLNRDVPASERAEVTDADIDAVERGTGVKDGRWTTANEERFAEQVVQYVREGRSPSPALQSVFAKFAVWLKDIFDTLSGQRVTVSPEMRAVLDRVFTRQERLTAAAQRQTGPPQTNTSAKDSRPPQTGPPSSVQIPEHRPYLTASMRPSEMMWKYVEATWGSKFGQQPIVDAVVNAAGRKGFNPGKPNRNNAEKVMLGDQKRNVLRWMDWNDAFMGKHEAKSDAAESKPTTGPPQSAKAPAPDLTLTPDAPPADVAPVTVHKDVLGSLDQIERDALARVKARREQAATVLFQGEAARAISPEDRADMVAIGTVQIARGLVQYAKWEEAMAAALGERVKPYLADVYRTSAQRAGALKEFTPDDYLNFRRLGVSEAEQQAMRALVTRTVIETGRLPKEHITFAEVRAEAEALHPDAVKHLAPWVPAQAQLRVVVDAARHRLNVLNREIYEAHKALVGVPEELALDRLRDIEAKERDARGLADTVMRMRSEAGRNLVVWRMSAGSDRWQDTTFWRMRAKRALGLPPGVDLPVDVERKILQIIEGGKDAIATKARTRRPAIPKSAEAKLAAAVAKMRAAMAAKAGPSTVLFQAERLTVDPSILDAARDFLTVAKDAGLNAEAAWATFAEMYGGGFDGARDAFESAIAEVYERDVTLTTPKPRKQTGPPQARAPRQKSAGAFDGLGEDDETPPGYEAPRERPTRQQRRAVEDVQAGAFGDRDDPAAGFIEDDGTVEYADPNDTPTRDRSREGIAGRRADRQTREAGQADAFDTGDSAIEAQVQRDLAALIVSLDKSGVLETISALRKAGLLTGIKTHMRNLGGNTGFQLVEEIARVPSVVVDFALSLATGQRSVQGLAPMAAGRSVREAATKGIKQAAEIMRDGVPAEDYLKTGSSRELNSGYAWLDAYANTTFRLLSAEDRVFKSYAYRRSMEEQAFLRAKNTGVSAAEILMAPTPAMITQAIADAEFATFNNKNLAAGALRQMQANLERSGTAGKALSFGIDLAVPFANTPANVLARVLDYTIAGAAVRVPVAAWRAYTAKALTSEQQRAIALGLGRGLTGSAIITLGYMAAAAGMATGGGDDDPADRNVATAAGRLPGAVLIGDRWHTISPFSPVGTLFALGASLHRARTRPMAQEAMRGDKLAIVATKLVMEQPMLSGLQDVQQALANPGRYGESFVSGLVGSFVPTLVSDVAGLFDPYRRDARPDGFSEAIWKGAAVRLPGIRNYLPERTDVLGRTQTQSKTGAVDPTLASRALELSDLVLKALLDADVGVTFPKREPDETADAYRARSVAVGKAIERQVRPIVARPGFPNWSMEKRKDALEDAILRGRRLARASGPPQRQAR